MKTNVSQTKCPQKGYFWYKNTTFSPFRSMLCPIWSTFSLIQCQITIFSPCWSNFSSHSLLLSPLPHIPDVRMPQFVLPCPAVTGFKLQTMVLDQKCKPSIHGHFKGSLPRPKTAFFGGIAQHGEGEGGESEPQIFFETSRSNWCATGGLPKLILTLFLWNKLLKHGARGREG